MKTEEDEYTEPFCRGWFDEQYRFLSGRSSALSVARLYNQFPAVIQKDTFFRLRSDPAKRTSTVLAPWVGEQLIRSNAEDDFARIDTLEQQACDDVALLSQSIQSEQRDAVEQRLEHFYRRNASHFLRIQHRKKETAQALGFVSAISYEETLGGYSYETLSGEAALFLQKTEDAYRDVLPYVLKKADPVHAAAGQAKAQWSDLQFALNLPWMAMAGHFDAKLWMDAISRWYKESGLNLESSPLKLDVEDFPHKSNFTTALPRSAPGRVILFHRPRGGAGAVDALLTLGALGEAQSFLHVTPNRPASIRWLRDTSLQKVWNSLFSLMLIDEGWLRRYLRLSPSIANDTARLCAFLILAFGRQAAAQLLYRLSCLRARASSEGADDKKVEEEEDYFDNQFRKFLGVKIPSAWAFPILKASEQSPFQVKGLALGCALRQRLQTQHDEDYWRNPAAVRWMNGNFAQGGAQTYPEVGAQMGVAEPRLTDATDLLLEKLKRW